MLPAVWTPSPDFKEAKDVIANYAEVLTKAAPPRVVALSSMGANRTSGLGMITALSLLEQGLRSLKSPVAFVRAGGFFENFLYGLQVAQSGTLPVFYNPTNRKSTMFATNDIGAEFDRLFQPLLLRHAYKDKDRQEAAIRASSLDWVIVRPAMLTNDPARGSVKAVTNLAGVKGGKIARADVARFVMEQLTTDTWLRQTPVILWQRVQKLS
jgi:uncharacterized protein YbjT (DUF2867 family)